MDHHHHHRRHPSRFVIEASEVESMAKSSGLSLPDLLHSLVKPAQALARPPISRFAVGAVGLGSDGRIFLGVNLEFPGLPLHHSVHAEQFLLTNLAAHRSPRLLRFAVSAAPCGHCRQFLQELRNASQIQILISSEIEIEIEIESQQQEKALIYKPLSSMLPNPFGPYDLLDEETPLLLEPHHNGLSFPLPIPNQNGNLSNGISELHMEKNEPALKMAALEAANSSHSPYSGCPSGVALMDCEGKIYRGSYTESAAYNPSLGPVQAALVAYVASGDGGGGYERIVGAVLVEKEGALVRQEHTAKLLLNVISPKCEFRVFHCCSSSSSSSSSPSSNGWKKGPSSCCE